MRACTRNNNTGIPEDATLTSMFGQWSENAAAIVGHMGQHSYLERRFDCSIGCDIWIGDDVFVGAGSVYVVTLGREVTEQSPSVSYVRTAAW